MTSDDNPHRVEKLVDGEWVPSTPYPWQVSRWADRLDRAICRQLDRLAAWLERRR